MSVNVSRTRLHGALKELLMRWDNAKAKWDDPVSRHLEARYLATLEPKVRNAVSAMEEMDAMLSQARRDCG